MKILITFCLLTGILLNTNANILIEYPQSCIKSTERDSAFSSNIVVSSDFEGANAGDWSVNESTYPIEVRVGPGSSESIWYFRISGVRDKTIRFVTDLNRFMRGDKLKQGIAYSYDNKRWLNVDNQDDGTQVIRFTEDVAYISLQPIVTNTTLELWYQDLPKLQHIQRRQLGITDGQPGELTWDREPLPVEPKAYDHGFPLWLYTISDTSKPPQPKRKILIMARECGWETQSTISSLALMEWLLSDDPLARRAREMAVWYFIPIANVDCAAAGLQTSMKLTWFNPDDTEYVSPYQEVGFIKDFIIEEFDGGRELDFAVRWHAFFQYATHIMKHQKSDRGNAIVQEEFDAIGAQLTINNYGIDRGQGKFRFDRWLRDELKLDIPLLTIEAGQYNTERDFEARRWITFEDHRLHGVAVGRYIARLLELD